MREKGSCLSQLRCIDHSIELVTCLEHPSTNVVPLDHEKDGQGNISDNKDGIVEEVVDIGDASFGIDRDLGDDDRKRPDQDQIRHGT